MHLSFSVAFVAESCWIYFIPIHFVADCKTIDLGLLDLQFSLEFVDIFLVSGEET